jgi:undecaprenyl diphosphate synthase
MSGLHVAVIMDGNGRWAQSRGLPRSAGHVRGVEALRAVVEAAPDEGIGTLTAYAFSSDNWKRPTEEIEGLLRLFLGYLVGEGRALARAGVRLTVIGRRDRLPPRLVRAIDDVEAMTLEASRLHLRLAIDYSARDALAYAAAASLATGPISRERIAEHLGSGRGLPGQALDVDLLIRTGGEQRLSDFLLWECAYAELWFTSTMWPDFGAAHLSRAVAAFRTRSRRFGGLHRSMTPVSHGDTEITENAQRVG